MNDLISKKAVIDLFEKYQPYMAVSVYEFGMALKALPSVQPEHNTGHWCLQIEYPKVSYYKCSVCGRIVSDDSGYDVTKDYPFCHCGADMRGDQNE